MYRIRSKFYKKEDMVFISHLDLVRLFERAFRRARIPISYTQGYNPHPIMSFATALGIGTSSDGEYMDIEVTEKIDLRDFMDKLNNVLPNGLEVIDSQYISKNEEALMAIIQYSSYIVKVRLISKESEDELNEKIKDFLSLEEIIEVKEIKRKKFKKGKNEVKENNIRPFIKSMSVINQNNNEVLFKMLLSTGSKGNLKPETVLNKFIEEMKIAVDFDSIRVHRMELYKEIEPEYVTPIQNIN